METTTRTGAHPVRNREIDLYILRRCVTASREEEGIDWNGMIFDVAIMFCHLLHDDDDEAMLTRGG